MAGEREKGERRQQKARGKGKGGGMSSLVKEILKKNIKLEYAAPEVQEGGACTSKSDMYSVGVILFQIIFPKVSIISCLSDNGNGGVLLPSIEDESLRDLLESLLSADPKRRLGADEALIHPYFNCVSISPNEVHSANIIDAFRDHLKLIRKSNEDFSSFSIEFSRISFEDANHENIRNTIFKAMKIFHKMTSEEFYRQLSIDFEDEEGIDAGALTTSFYEQFFNGIFHPAVGLFEKGDFNYFLPVKHVPDAPETKKREKHFFTIGKIISKALFDGRNPNVKFSSVVYKFLIHAENLQVTFNDFEMFFQIQARNLRHLLINPGAENLILNFENLCPNGEEKEVTDDNKHQFAKLKIQYELVTSRLPYLKAIRDGLLSVISIEKQLNLFTHFDLELLMLGEQRITPADIISSLVFEGCPIGLEDNLKTVINRFVTEELRLFLHFITNEVSIPVGGLCNPSQSLGYPSDKITVIPIDSSMYPVAHTCWYRIDIPVIGAEEMYQRFIETLANHKHSAGAFLIA